MISVLNRYKQIKNHYTGTLFYYNGYEASYSVKPFYIIFNEIYGYTEHANQSKYLF